MIKIDRAEFQVIETGEGFLKARVTFAVPGVFPYLYIDGVHLEAKLPEDILSQPTIESAKGAPITDGHPTDQDGNPILVTAENYQRYAKGNISEPHVEMEDGRAVGVALATIYDSALIQDIKNKVKDSVSIGFICEEDATPGQFAGVHYDTAQKNIRINHLACVELARAGEATKIHIDRGINMAEVKTAVGAGEITPDGKTFTYRKTDGADIQVSQEAHSELMVMKEKVKADEDMIKSLRDQIAAINPSIPDEEGVKGKQELLDKIDALTAEVDAWKEKYNQLEAAVPEMADQAATEKVEVLEAAKGVDGIQTDGLSTKEIKLAIIGKGLPFKPEVKIDGLSNDVINARYDAAVELLKKTANIPQRKTMIKDTVKIDASVIEEKKRALLNQYKGGK